MPICSSVSRTLSCIWSRVRKCGTHLVAIHLTYKCRVLISLADHDLFRLFPLLRHMSTFCLHQVLPSLFRCDRDLWSHEAYRCELHPKCQFSPPRNEIKDSALFPQVSHKFSWISLPDFPLKHSIFMYDHCSSTLTTAMTFQERANDVTSTWRYKAHARVFDVIWFAECKSPSVWNFMIVG